MSYRKDPYKKLEESWDGYKKNIKSLNIFLEKIYYDGFLKNCFENSEKISSYPEHYLVEEDPIWSQLFILPQAYELLPLDNLFQSIAPPEFPIPQEEPALRLEQQEYPEWYLKSIERDVEGRNNLILEMNDVKNSIQRKKNEFIELHSKLQTEIDDLKIQLTSPNAKAIARLIEIVHLRHHLPNFLKRKFTATTDADCKVLLIEFTFPDYENENLIIGFKGKYSFDQIPKYASETQKKKLVKQCLYSMIIRAAYLGAKFRQHNLYETVVVNVEQEWFDPATGQPRNGMIASLQAPIEYLTSLDLSKLDPESCFKYLKGISTPSLQNISPIRPIFVLNKEDDRLVSNKDVDGELEPESNLAAMSWEDFEHLVAQLFEWEFSKNGVEVRVTRASRDRGVDAILFDPDSLKGGKYVLQAKRYTRTVDVSAVRDLYGTVMNEGANRGILITTSSYGPDAYEFAKDKPLSLVDGQNLLVMLQKHGKKFRIDLEEARRLNMQD